MKNLLFLFFAASFQLVLAQTPCVGGTAGVYPCDGYDLQSRITLGDMNASSGNDSWGWTDPTNNNEYALMGLSNGTAFVDITDPVNPIYLGKLPTHTSSSTWRDIKVYNNYAFIVSEAGGHGMQVFDLTRLRTASPGTTFNSDAHYPGFGSCHNIIINEDSGYAYAVGTSLFNGGPHFIDISNPLAPVGAGGYALDDYSHDAQVVIYNGPDSDYTGREILVGSNTNEMSIVDITDKSNPVSISTVSYSNVGYTHQGWFTDDQRYFIVGDETDELDFGIDTRTIVFDFNDLDNPSLDFEYTGPTPAIDHNGYVVGDKYFMANYRAGIRILDVSTIGAGSLSEEGYFDTYPNNDNAQFDGAWSVYPYFGSGNIVISDINRGLFIVKSSAVDTTDPVAVCQNFTAELNADGEVVVAGSDVDGGSSDNSGTFTITLSQNIFGCSDLGANTVTVTITDPSGNTDTCTATITVEDNLGAAFDCYASETVEYDAGNAFYTLPDYIANGDVTATDNCTTSLTITQTPAAGTQLTEGTYVVAFETTDDEGNTSSCEFTLTVVPEILAVTETLLSEGLSMYPNPTVNEFNIVSERVSITDVAIFDISGKRLINQTNLDTSAQKVDISNLSAGIYFVQINNLVTRRIIKK